MRRPLAVLLLTACAPAPETAETRVLVTLDDVGQRVGQWALCRPGPDGTIRLRADEGIVTCGTDAVSPARATLTCGEGRAPLCAVAK